MSVTCPRCDAEVTQEFYGPCTDCRDQLRQLQPPAPDPHFRLGSKMDQSAVVYEYVGPLVDDPRPGRDRDA